MSVGKLRTLGGHFHFWSWWGVC